jgi:hypothetical protein
MTKAERTERMPALSRLALGLVRRCGERGGIDRDGARYRLSEVRHNEFRITFLRPIGDDNRASTLDVRFDGKTVLCVEWLPEAVQRTFIGPEGGKRCWRATIARRSLREKLKLQMKEIGDDLYGRNKWARYCRTWRQERGGRGTFQRGLAGNGLAREALWDGQSELFIRDAFPEEQEQWRKSQAIAIREGEIDDDDAEDWVHFLVALDPGGNVDELSEE